VTQLFTIPYCKCSIWPPAWTKASARRLIATEDDPKILTCYVLSENPAKISISESLHYPLETNILTILNGPTSGNPVALNHVSLKASQLELSEVVSDWYNHCLKVANYGKHLRELRNSVYNSAAFGKQLDNYAFPDLCWYKLFLLATYEAIVSEVMPCILEPLYRRIYLHSGLERNPADLFHCSLYWNVAFLNKASNPCNRPWWPIRLWDVEVSHWLDSRLTDGRPRSVPRRIFWYLFLLEAE
jgi:hypothetical protein